MIKVAINGFGRIGRMVLRAHYESGKKHGLQFVASTILRCQDQRASAAVRHRARALPPTACASTATASPSATTASSRGARDPAKLPWKDLGVDVVMECTGLFTSKAKSGAHLQAGAKK